jgi:cytochrome c biogenesis protein CcdA
MSAADAALKEQHMNPITAPPLRWRGERLMSNFLRGLRISWWLLRRWWPAVTPPLGAVVLVVLLPADLWPVLLAALVVICFGLGVKVALDAARTRT